MSKREGILRYNSIIKKLRNSKGSTLAMTNPNSNVES